MRKICIWATLVVAVLLSSCKKDTFDLGQIPGKWQKGTELWVFEESGLGHTWDPADDVTEEEAQSFSWEVSEVGSKETQMTITHYGEMGEVIPKTYTLVRLSATTMVLRDELSGKDITYTKIE